MSAPVVVDDEPNGLAVMLAGLLEGNLARRPRRAVSLRRPTVVEVVAADAGVAATVTLSPGVVRVSNGSVRRPDVRIRASGRDLLDLSGAPLRAGLPDALSRDGRAVVAKLIRGDVRIVGLLRHPIVVARFARLLSAR